MSGTIEGGRKAAAKNLERDPDFYRKIGRKGGQAGHTGGFAANPELARIAGRKGGQISKRGPAKPKEQVFCGGRVMTSFEEKWGELTVGEAIELNIAEEVRCNVIH